MKRDQNPFWPNQQPDFTRANSDEFWHPVLDTARSAIRSDRWEYSRVFAHSWLPVLEQEIKVNSQTSPVINYRDHINPLNDLTTELTESIVSVQMAPSRVFDEVRNMMLKKERREREEQAEIDFCNRNPLVKEAWENYQAVLRLHGR